MMFWPGFLTVWPPNAQLEPIVPPLAMLARALRLSRRLGGISPTSYVVRDKTNAYPSPRHS